MALKDILDIASSKRKIGVSEERINAIKPTLRQYIAFWREYPDLFVDFMQTGGNPDKKITFHLFFYQRVFLRIGMRFKYVYAVYPRAYSKSFLSVMIQMIRCILYPGAHIFSAAGGKEQSAQILSEKIEDICTKIPAFRREINWERGGGTVAGKDHCRYVFKNSSQLQNVAASERSRGLRQHAGLIEECVGVDQKILQEVLIPMMNVSRRCLDGTVQPDEVLNQSQLFITTAGYKNTFSYDKLIQLLVKMIIEPDKAFIMGGTYRIPIVTGLLPATFVNDLKNDPTFNEEGFQREYESRWTGTVEGAFFNGETFDKMRILQQPEYEYSGRSSLKSYYVLSCDVGRKGCDSVVCVFKVIPQSTGPAVKSLVNIYTMSDEHFEDQAIKLKSLYYKYHARRLVIDGNGLGIGLIDYMIKPQSTAAGDEYPDFGVFNDDEGYYKKYQTKQTELDAIYIIKANAPINTEAHANVQTQLNAGKIKLLTDEKTAKNKLLGTKVGQKMTSEQRNEYLIPFNLTSILKEEMLNLREENEGVNIILKQANKRIHKDKFSSFEYGLYYIKIEEESKKKKKKFKASDYAFMN